ncbi:MAG TPA: DegT/DnrJ/EryC1/StrS family aminotransferase [Bryobacteraceae bacterium]|jgi:dTDP-4-amino-4,6-dideoxygalactose transaminase|nr:DegT/DnrJ/EryC1/StrS family aminotransferase [Bryobacteraceae bacterium]
MPAIDSKSDVPRVMTAIQSRSIPFFDYPSLFEGEQEMLVSIFRDAGLRGAFILQRDLARFEENLARFLGAHYAVGVGNATDGLIIALRAAGIRKGDEVIFSSHTMVATAAAIHFAQGIPVPVECGPDHLIDPDAVAAAITPRTRAILPTQLNGRTADMTALQNIANKNGLVIVEDAAQALGSKFRGQCAGTFGAASAISFFPAKVLGCLGDGGAVIANSSCIHGRVLQLRDHGRRADGEIVSWGLNSRLDNLQAAILDARLKKYQSVIDRRRALARLYRSRLSKLEEIKLPPGPDGDPDHFDIFQNYEIEACRRDALRAHLQASGIGTLLPWGGKAVHQWEKLGFTEKLPFTEKLFGEMLLLPLNMALAEDDVNQICDAIQDFYCPS